MNNKTRILVFIIGLVSLYLTSCNSPAGSVQPESVGSKYEYEITRLAVTGKVTDAFTGLPISGAMIELLVGSNGGVPLKRDDCSTDQAGQYLVNCDLLKNHRYGYELNVCLEGYLLRHYGYSSIQLKKGTTLIVDFELESD